MKTVIFDFNGTLFWDSPYHNEAFLEQVRRHSGADGVSGVSGGPAAGASDGTVEDPGALRARPITVQDIREHIMGRTNDQIMRFIFGEHITDAEVDFLAREKEALYREICAGETCFAPGAEALFAALKDAGITYGIATSAPAENIDFYYEHMDMEKWFPRRNVVFADGSLRGKPAPDIFLKAMNVLGGRPEDTAIFEDSAAGLMAAEASGAALVVAVDAGDLPPYASGRFPVITDFRQALPLLGL